METREVSDEEFQRPNLRALTKAYHDNQCHQHNYGSADTCSFGGRYGWDSDYEEAWGPHRRWMSLTLKALERAEADGLTLLQFVATDLLGQTDGTIPGLIPLSPHHVVCDRTALLPPGHCGTFGCRAHHETCGHDSCTGEHREAYAGGLVKEDDRA